jgi:hypothetical protein
MKETSSLPLELLAKLRDAEGEGLSRDPKNNPRKTIKLLQDKDARSKWCPPGARAGQYLVGGSLCDNFTCTPILYKDIYIEWKVDGGGGPETHYALPADAKWDQEARCWFRDNGNSVEEGAEIISLVNGEVCPQSFRLGALKVARQLNSAAGALVIETDQGPVQLPFYGANWRMGAIEKHASNGKSFWQETYEHVGTVGQPGGPTWDEFDRCQALCRFLTRSIKPARVAGTAEETDQAASEPPFWENPPESDAPPLIEDDPPPPTEDDIIAFEAAGEPPQGSRNTRRSEEKTGGPEGPPILTKITRDAASAPNQ